MAIAVKTSEPRISLFTRPTGTPGVESAEIDCATIGLSMPLVAGAGRHFDSGPLALALPIGAAGLRQSASPPASGSCRSPSRLSNGRSLTRKLGVVFDVVAINSEIDRR
jgi:hypothetical protein